MKPDEPIAIGDRAIMRKPHPCGSAEWMVTRIGADIGMRCMGCGRRVLIPRREFIKGTRTLIHAQSSIEPAPAAPVDPPADAP
ncbi:MAG: DUF951 domain-containing protein [bacterium]|nr:DUF951 domain-containing protein [bacterium]